MGATEFCQMENNIVINSKSPQIFCLRGMNVMMDADLAKLYGVSTTRMNEQVKRNKKRFPDRFCFQMTNDELKNWISQNATSKSQRMGIRKCPWVFTEYGVAMVSSVLNSTLAVEVSIQIIQSFIEIKRASSAVHDRFLILDNQSLYHLGASLKDLGKRWFAFSKMDGIIADVMKRLP